MLSFVESTEVSESSPYSAALAVAPSRLENSASNHAETALVDTLMGRFMERWKIPAASVAILRDGALVYAKGFGHTDTSYSVATDPHHLFRIASVSKLVTAVAVLKLQEQGKLSLDDKVFGELTLLPVAKYGAPWQKRAYDITVRHLLEHTSGFSWRTLGDPAFQPQRIAADLDVPLPITRPQLIRWQLQQHLPYRPGTRYSYSNVGYMMLHEIVEQVSGMTYEDFVRAYVLLPAGIHDMRLGGSLAEQRHFREVMYHDHPGAPLRESVVNGDTLAPRPYGGTDIDLLGGAGGWTASAEDLARLVAAIDGNPTFPDILSEASVATLTKRGKSRYPLGWKTVNGNRWVRTGSLAGTNAIVYRLDERTTYVAIINQSQWNEYRFNRTMHAALSRALATINTWPEDNLFELPATSPTPTLAVK